VAVNSLGEPLFRLVFAASSLPHARDWATAAAKGTAAGSRQRTDNVTSSRVWRRGGRLSVVRRGGWRAILVAQQPNLGLTKVPSRNPPDMATRLRTIRLTNGRQTLGDA